MSPYAPWLVLFGLACGLVPLLAVLLRGTRFDDVPGDRSTHERTVVRVGGIVVLFGALGAVATILLPLLVYPLEVHGLLGVLIPAIVFFGIGLLDDLRGLRAGPKFLMQAGAAVLAVALGLRWEGLALEPFGALTFGGGTPVMTWLWIVAVVTLINLIDGMDLITALTCLVVLAAGAGAGEGGGAVLWVGASLGLLGFIPWNLRPARAFLGDAGTHLLGFLVASLALHVPGDGHGLPWVMASAPLLPAVIDLFWGFVMKARMGVRLTKAHNQHLSQRLVHAGWSHAAVAVRYGLLSLVGLALVGWVAPRFGLLPCLGVAAVVLLLHLTHAIRAARGVPYRF